MEIFPWWTDEHKRFDAEVNTFVDEMMPVYGETKWTREFPWEIFRLAGERGYAGAAIPKEYGGYGLGATGGCIVAEAMSRMIGIGFPFIANMLGGLRQIIEFGTEEQKERFLPRIVKGEMGAICITEPFAGTDAAGIETTARRKGGQYIISGKKRYIVSAGVADRHMLYAKTSDDSGDRRGFQHLTAFIVEKGMPGFSVEKINEVIGFDNVQNGVLNLDEVPVPVENRIGEEGAGWRVMTGGLNFERTLISAQAVGWLREVLRNTVSYAKRRVQFGQPTINFVNNQFKVADLIVKLRMERLITYYTAYLWDLGWDVTIESTVSKLFNCENAMQASLDAMQVMGGDSLTSFYPVETAMKVSKVNEIAGGTMEACRLIIYRTGLRQMAKDLENPRRVIHEKLGVPVPAYEKPPKRSKINEAELLKVLADDYLVNPGLHMSREDLKEEFDVEDEALDRVILSLEEDGLVKVYRGRKGIELVKASYKGLNQAYPSEHYQWFPSWVDEKRRF
jgi:alkylation response protein AidB-like acyl-CoA dehydrogenase